MYTYPTLPDTGGDLSAEQIHQLLKDPTLIARRLETLLDNKFIADYLLTGRYTAQGGAILYPNGDPIFAADDPEAVAPGAEYPLTPMTVGDLASAKTVKWGQDSEVTDEAISRLRMDPVNRVLTGLANSLIRYIDGVALSVIAAQVTDTYASQAWATAEAIVEGVLLAKATQEDRYDLQDYDLTTVVLTPLQFAKVSSLFINSNLLPRENGNAVQSGVITDVLGLTWTTSKHAPFPDPLLVDRDRLGGMANENLASPGYTNRDGLEVKVIRQDETDSYRPRARRVTVPVVMDPGAAVRITGTTLEG